MQSHLHRVEIPGGSIQARVADVEGPPALLVHGGPGGTDYLFKFFARPLVERGYQPISFIQRGSNGSPCAGPFTNEEMSQDIERVRDALHLHKPLIVAHSYGCLLSAAWATTNPDEAGPMVFICPVGPRPGWREEFEATIHARLGADERARIAELREAAKDCDDPAEYQRLKFEIADIQVRAYFGAAHRDDQPGLAELNIRVREEALRDLKTWEVEHHWARAAALAGPFSIIHGMEDPIPARTINDWTSILPHARRYPLDRCGHFPWFEDKEAFWHAFAKALEP